jgi:hypothetical protein
MSKKYTEDDLKLELETKRIRVRILYRIESIFLGLNEDIVRAIS